MALPFGKNSTPPNKPNRNVFDKSFQNNLTMDYGKLYPFMVEPVIPGDSSKIDVAFGIRALPTAFPVQTKLRVDAHFFYVRNRNLWSEWPNFIGNTGLKDKYILPYLSQSSLFRHMQTGSLGDYLGLPSTVVGDRTVDYSIDGRYQYLFTYPSVDGPNTSFASQKFNVDTLSRVGVSLPAGHSLVVQNNLERNEVCQFILFSGRLTSFFPYLPGGTVTFHLKASFEALKNALSGVRPGYTLYPVVVKSNDSNSSGWTTYSVVPEFGLGSVKPADGGFDVEFHPSSAYETIPPRFGLAFIYLDSEGKCSDSYFASSLFDPSNFNVSENKVDSFTVELVGVTSVDESLVSQMPRISALPFRAYESIYNSFYRDQRNNPYILNGVHDPNVYIPSTAGAQDNNDYDLRSRNWEQDYLTTAVPSPQQGAAPLVGITSSGVATFADENGAEHSVKLTTADDGDTITGAEYSSNLPNSVSRALVDIATSGISISDFRNVNSLQRWLEINMRRGLKYKDQILSHFGVDVDYAALDMPEFLGGFTKFFDSSQINQSVEAEDSPLGSYAGQLSCVGGTEHQINRYFDEHGYIIGIVSIVPVPVYSQSLNKDFLKRSPLDYYFPEFGHISFQPIKYSEVAPLQALVNNIPLSDTFGYQRPWYEYLSSTDQAHGDFRTTLRDFLLGRTFNSVPSLQESFLTVDASQINNVFTADSYIDDDGNRTRISPFLGQIHIKNIMKRPIPLFGIPRLE